MGELGSDCLTVGVGLGVGSTVPLVFPVCPGEVGSLADTVWFSSITLLGLTLNVRDRSFANLNFMLK